MTDDLSQTFTGRVDGAERLASAPLAAMCATLDLPERNWADGAAIPAGWQWLYFLPLTAQSAIGADGRMPRAAELPGGHDARRMFAGGRMRFARPLRAGTLVRRDSSVLPPVTKQGRGGALQFVTTRLQYCDEMGVALEEEQDIVFRPTGALPAPAAAAIPAAPWQREINTDPVLLFRFSALTFNGHRIHYDEPYAKAEGYPGLVVHGPLLAILLLDLAARNVPGRHAAEFSFRARAPVFVDAPVSLRGEPDADGTSALLTAYRHDGVTAMTAELGFSKEESGAPLGRG